MDVGYYIGELLGQHGEVSVPGLGYFAHTRVNGYYNEKDEKFYPPGYSVQFDPQFIEDDALAQHIAANKNISVASSKYFIEKYVANLRYLAASGETPIAEIGWFKVDLGKLEFRSNNNLSTDPEFFGFPAVSLHKVGTAPKMVTVVEEVDQIETNEQQFETDQEHEAYLLELTTKRRRKTLWVFVILLLLLGGLFYYLYNKYDRSAFDLEKKEPANTDSIAKAKPEPVKKPKSVLVGDSSQMADDDETVIIAKRNGTVDSVSIAPPDTTSIKGLHFEILGGTFANNEEANRAIANYKSLGIDSKILQNVPGKKKKVTLGSFATRQEAIDAQKKLLNTGKIKSASMYIQQYNK